MGKREPEQLKRGKRFHKLVQDEWVRDLKAKNDGGRPNPESTIERLSGRRGRVDILIDEIGDMVSVVEIKATDWDRMAERNVRRNVRRQIRQIWSYIEAQLELEGMQACPGIIFPHLPSDPERTRLIEEMFLEEGIPVVWHDETIEDMQRRVGQRSGGGPPPPRAT